MIERTEPFRAHTFEYACAVANIDHRLTKPKHPWTNGQVERMNRTIKGAAIGRFHYDTHDQLRTHLADFVMAYNFATRLKTAGSGDVARSFRDHVARCSDMMSPA